MNNLVSKGPQPSDGARFIIRENALFGQTLDQAGHLDRATWLRQGKSLADAGGRNLEGQPSLEKGCSG